MSKPKIVNERVNIPREAFVVEQADGTKCFNGSWYRGENTNFYPSKKALRAPDAVYQYYFQGLVPDTPFIQRDTPITAFGSCFAHHVSNYLFQRQYNILGKDLDLDAHIIRFGEGIVNTFAILQQLEWALNNKEMPEDLWFSKDKEIAGVSASIKEETKEILLKTEVFIFTLGLSEVWFDNQSGEALWRAVPLHLFDPERHVFRQTTVSENSANIRKIIDVIKHHKPEAKIVFTLSPVPLIATFRPIPCPVANAVSKSTLRCALDEVLRSDEPEDVFYFPSYEIVTSGGANAFKDDNHHVRPEVVGRIMQYFEQYFCNPASQS